MYLYYLCGLFCLIWIDFGEFLVILLISGLLHLSTLIGWVLLVEFSTFTLKFATSKTVKFSTTHFVSYKGLYATTCWSFRFIF